MSVIECANCGAHSEGEEFCPSCGEFLGPDGFEEFSLDHDAPVAQVPYNSVSCPSCGAGNPSTNRHCEECGARLMQGALPVAPQPILSSNPGARAALAITALIVFIVIIAFTVNRIGGDGAADDAAPTDTSSTTSTSIALSEIELIAITTPECSSQLGPSWSCDMMFDGDPETQWNDEKLSGLGATITVRFPATYQLETIVLSNLVDPVRFERNFRVASVKITTNDNPQGSIQLLPNLPGSHTITFSTLATTEVTLEVQTTHQAEAVVDAESGEELRAFTELVIAELEFYGRRSSG